MDFVLTEEQAELASMIEALLGKRSDSAAVRTAIASEDGHDSRLWETLCTEVGVAALAVPEAYDGFGASLVETCLVLERLGANLAPTPLAASLVATEALLAADEEARDRLLPRIAAGETATVALDPDRVPWADAAAIVLLVEDDALFEVTGASVSRLTSLDPTLRLAALDLTDATTTRIGGADAVARARLADRAANLALGLGCLQRALDMTVAYSKERVQFGRAIGSFQALKHRMADMLVLVEMSRSAVRAAGYAVATGSEDAEQLTHVASSYVGDALQQVGGELVQLHGGIAITAEHDAQLVFKRAHALRTLTGLPHEHRARVVL